jgi:hypothetical protein
MSLKPASFTSCTSFWCLPALLALLTSLLYVPGSGVQGQETPIDEARRLYDQGRFADAEVALTAVSEDELLRHQDAVELLLRIRLRVLDLDGVISAGWGSFPLLPSSVVKDPPGVAKGPSAVVKDPPAVDKSPPALRSAGSALIMGQTLLLMGRKDVAVPVLDVALDLAESISDQHVMASALLAMGLATWIDEPSATMAWESSLMLAEQTFHETADEVGAATARLHLWRLKMKTHAFRSIPNMADEARDELTGVLEIADRLGHGPLAAGAGLVLDDVSSLDSGADPADLDHLLRAWRVLESNPRSPRERSHLPDWLLPEPTELFRRLVARFMTEAEEAGGAQGGKWPDDPAGRAAWKAFFFADRMHAWRTEQLRAEVDSTGTRKSSRRPILDTTWTAESSQTLLDILSAELSLSLGEIDAALLEYVLGRDETYAFVVTEQGLAAERLAITRRKLDSLVVEIVGPWFSRGASGVELSSFLPDSTQRVRLYVSLFMALEGYFPQQGPLLTVPDGSLIFLPLEMLLRPARRPLSAKQVEVARSHLLGDWEGEPVLLERYDFAYILSSEDVLGGDHSDRAAGDLPRPAPRGLLWSGPRGQPQELMSALPSWERLRDFFVPDPLFLPSYERDYQSSLVLLRVMSPAAAILTDQPESHATAENVTKTLKLQHVQRPPPVAHVALPFFPRESEPWNSFLLGGTSGDAESLVERVSVAELRELPLSGSFLSLASGCVLNPLHPYLHGGPEHVPWNDLSPRGGKSLLVLRLAASDAGVRALGMSLWPTGQAQLMLDERVYNHVGDEPADGTTKTLHLIRAWNRGRRDLRHVISELDAPHHAVSLAHPFFWAGSVFSL